MIIQASVSRWMRTGGLTFPHGAVGSLETWDKGGLQSCLDYLMPLVPEVASQSLSSPLLKNKQGVGESKGGKKKESKREEEQSVEWVRA